MSRRDRQLELMKEELKTYVWVSAEEMCANIDARFALIFNAVTPPPLPQPLPQPDPKGKEEEVESISSSEDEEYQEEEEEEEKKKSKRKRRQTKHYSPSLDDDKDDDEGEPIAEAGTSRTDKAQWKALSKLSPDERAEHPWWQHRFGEPLAAIRDALGYQSRKNKGPREVWDQIMDAPEEVTQQDTDGAFKQAKCGLCGQSKKCSQSLKLGNGTEVYLGSTCAQLAANLTDFALRHMSPTSLEDLDEALGWVMEAHSSKRRRRR